MWNWQKYKVICFQGGIQFQLLNIPRGESELKHWIPDCPHLSKDNREIWGIRPAAISLVGESIWEKTSSCGLRRAECMWPTSEGNSGLLMKPLRSCINVLIHFFAASINSLLPFLPHHLPPLAISLFHSLPLQVTWTSVWPCDGCPAVSLFPQWSGQQSALWSIIPRRLQEHMDERD